MSASVAVQGEQGRPLWGGVDGRAATSDRGVSWFPGCDGRRWSGLGKSGARARATF
jgi:hypothetical protein